MYNNDNADNAGPPELSKDDKTCLEVKGEEEYHLRRINWLVDKAGKTS